MKHPLPTATRPDSEPALRLYSLDALRLAAIAMVVVQHAAVLLPQSARESVWLSALSGLTIWNIPALFLLSGYVSGVRVRRGAPALDRGRFFRLLVPYLAWGTFYTLAFAVQASAQGVPVRWPSVLDILTGQGVYFILWFLPMLMYCGLIAAPLRTARSAFRGGLVSGVTWLAAVVVLLELNVPSQSASPAGFLYHLPLFLACFLLAKALALEPSRIDRLIARPPIAMGALAAALLALSALVASAGLGHVIVDEVTNALAFGIASLFLAGALRHPSLGQSLPGFWRRDAPYGIYLSHMAVLELVNKLLPAAGPPWFYWLLLAAVGFFGSGAAVWLLLAVPLIRPALGRPPREARLQAP